jgi:bacteriocin biosynthesis cyclodehydratase domain-containing protein
VTSVAAITTEPPLLRLTLGPHPGVPAQIEQEVTGELVYFLSLADGHLSARACWEKVHEEFGSPSLPEFETALAGFIARGVIVDGAEHPELSAGRTDRFARHLLFYASLGANGPQVQERLKRARVALIGVGGIGTWLSYLLGAAGLGTLRLIDGDAIELSNLTRQVLYTQQDLGRLKVEVARERLLNINPELHCTGWSAAIRGPEDLEAAVGEVDLIVLSGDKPHDINELVDAYSVRRGIAWTRAGYAQSLGLCGPLLVPGRTGCQACVSAHRPRPAIPLSELPLIDAINGRFQVPSFGPLNGVVASMAAKEAIAWLGGLERHVATLGATVAFDVLGLQSSVVPLPRSPDCARCGHLFKG